MAEFRRRKASRHKTGYHQKNGFTRGGGHAPEGITIFGWGLQQVVFNMCGILLCIFCGYKHAMYVNLVHEGNLWFSNIKVSFANMTGLIADHRNNLSLSLSKFLAIFQCIK